MLSAVTTRVFYGTMADAPGVHNGAWLSAFLGAALAIPALYIIRKSAIRAREASKSDAAARTFLCAAFAAALVLDAAKVLEGVAISAGCVIFERVAAQALVVPLLLVALRAIWLGGDAIGYAARAWVFPFALLTLLVILLQAHCFRPGWLAPVLGFGLRGFARAGIRSAGWTVMIAGAVLLLNGREEVPGFLRITRDIGTAGAVAAALIALRLMITPSMDAPGMQRMVQIDSLLTNGRAPLSFQLPMIVIWFGGLLTLYCLECWAAAALIGRCLTGSDVRLIGILVVAATSLIALCGADFIRAMGVWEDNQLWALTAAAVPSAFMRSAKGGKRACGVSG